MYKSAVTNKSKNSIFFFWKVKFKIQNFLDNIFNFKTSNIYLIFYSFLFHVSSIYTRSKYFCDICDKKLFIKCYICYRRKSMSDLHLSRNSIIIMPEPEVNLSATIVFLITTAVGGCTSPTGEMIKVR